MPSPITRSPPASRGTTRLESTQFLLPPNPNVAYSACLMHKVEEMIETGQAPYPVERTLLVSGVLESCLESKIQGGRPIETPHLNIRYGPPPRRSTARLESLAYRADEWRRRRTRDPMCCFQAAIRADSPRVGFDTQNA